MNLDGFLKGEYVINCETKEQADKLMADLSKLGIHRLDTWHVYGSQTCFEHTNLGLSYELMYADIEYFTTQEKRKIVKFSELADKPAEDFEPTKKFLMEHKDEYAIKQRNTDEGIREYFNSPYFDENLMSTAHSDYDVIEIYKKVWTRPSPQLRELTIEQAEREFGVKIRRDVV